jgi:hypothetical protein
MDLDTLLFDNKRLAIDNHYEDLAKLFCNLAGQETSRTKERFVLNSWYEGFIYTLLIGIHTGNRQKHKDRLNKTSYWSGHYRDQYKYAIAFLLTKEDILNELNISSYDDIAKNYTNIEETLKSIHKICEEFSNGGLKFLKEQYENDNSIFEDYDCLKNIMKTVIENKN